MNNYLLSTNDNVSLRFALVSYDAKEMKNRMVRYKALIDANQPDLCGLICRPEDINFNLKQVYRPERISSSNVPKAEGYTELGGEYYYLQKAPLIYPESVEFIKIETGLYAILRINTYEFSICGLDSDLVTYSSPFFSSLTGLVSSLTSQ